MRKSSAIALATAVAAVAFAILGVMGGFLYSEYRDRAASTGVVGQQVAAFVLEDVTGRDHRLPSPGQRVLINYWATWCHPCLKEMPVLQAYAKRQPAQGVQVVGIALDADVEGTRAWLASNPIGYPILIELPSGQDSAVRLGNPRGLLPYSVLVGADGRVRATHMGAFPTEKALEAWVAKAP